MCYGANVNTSDGSSRGGGMAIVRRGDARGCCDWLVARRRFDFKKPVDSARVSVSFSFFRVFGSSESVDSKKVSLV